MTVKLFGRKWEKLSPEEDLQGRLFNEFENSINSVEEKVKEEKIKVAPHERRKSDCKSIPEELPCVIINHDLTEEVKIYACGNKMEKIGEEAPEKLDIIPPKIQV